MEEPWSLVKNAVYMVEAPTAGGLEYGGGVCIHPDGLVLTVATLVPLDNNPYDLMVRSLDMDFRSTRVIKLCRRYNVCLLSIRKKFVLEQFPFVNLNDNCSMMEKKSIFTYTHQHDLSFTLYFANISYPLPPLTQDNFPEMVLNDADISEEFDYSVPDLNPKPYRTTGEVGGDNTNVFKNVDPSLPLLEVHGFCALDGFVGSPAFKMNGDFVGLLAFEKASRIFAIPVNFLHSWVVSNMGPMDKISRRLPETPGGGQQRGQRRSSSRRQDGQSSRGHVETREEALCKEYDQCSLDGYTKSAALRVSPCVVSIISPNLPDEMTVFRGRSRYERSYNDYSERIFGGSGVIIDCEDAGDGTYFITILTIATLFVRTNGVQPNEIEVEVYRSDGKLYIGEVLACDFHYNLAAIRIVSDTPIQTAQLKGLDDIISIDRAEQSRLHEEKAFQLDLCKILPGDKVITLARRFENPYSLSIACATFSLERSTLDCKELYCATGIDSEGYHGGPVINYSGEVIGIMFCSSAFMPINIVSRWWLHYKNYSTSSVGKLFGLTGEAWVFTLTVLQIKSLKFGGEKEKRLLRQNALLAIGVLDWRAMCREFYRPWTGFEVTNLHLAPMKVLVQFTQKFHHISSGVVVTKVEEDSPAYCSGIRPLDVIVQCDGQVVRSTLEFFEKIWDKGENSVELIVLRASNGSRLNLTLIISETTPDRFYRPTSAHLNVTLHLIKESKFQSPSRRKSLNRGMASAILASSQ